jgi:PKD repeat protein
LFAVWLLAASAASATDYFVAPDGDDHWSVTGNTAYYRELTGEWLPASGVQIANENETDWTDTFPSSGNVIADNLWVQTDSAPLTALEGDLTGIVFSHNLWHGSTPGAAALGAGTVLAEVTADYDGDTRADPPALGAFEPEPSAGPRTFHVATTGSDAGDGSAGSPWRTLSHAAAQALAPGDLVLVAPGVYVEDLALTRSGAEVVPVTTDVSIIGSDTLRFPAGTDLSGVDLSAHADELYLYVYRSWRANNGVYRIVATGSDAAGPWVRVAAADFNPEDGAAGDPTRLTAAIGRPIVFRNASPDPANNRVVIDASGVPGAYTVLYIGDYLDPMDAEPVDWIIVDGIDLTGSPQGGGVHIQDSSFNVIMNSRISDMQGAGILIAGNQPQPARWNLVWKNVIWNTPDEGVYVGAGGHGASANHAYWTHVVGNDISTQGSAANAVMENAIDLKEYNFGDLVEGNLIHDYDLMTGYNGAIDIRDGKHDVLVYNNVLRDIGRDNNSESSVIHLYGGSRDVIVANNLLFDTRAGGSPVYAFNIDATASTGIRILHNTVRGLSQGLLLEDYGTAPDVTIAGNAFDFYGGGIEQWGSEGRFALQDNLYTANPGGYAGEPGRIIADPLWLDPAAGDFHLQPGSPAVDVGDEVNALLPLDLDGNPRLADAAPDLGVYELVAAPQPPSAAFSASPTAGAAPLTVQFTDASTGLPTSRGWDFGDGGVSTDESPSHVYSAPGSYTVTLTVGNDRGSDTLTRTDLIQVSEPVAPPTAGFTASPTSGEAPLAVQFTDGSTGADGWHWDFGDSATSSAQHPSHVYSAPGSYTVVQTVTNAGGSDGLTRVGYIQVAAPPAPPVAAFTASPTTGAAPLTVQFTDTSTGGAATGWSWDFGDGATATAQSPSHVYAAPGSYDVTLTVSNADGTDSVTRAGLITVTEPGARENILFDGFEAGLDAWWTEGNVTLSSLEPKHGAYAMRFTGNNIWVERYVSTAGYEQIRLSVWIEAQNFEDWEYLIVYWHDGQDWYEPVSIDTGHPAAAGNGLTLIEIDLPAGAADNPSFGVAFGMWGTGGDDVGIVDDLLITGVPLGGGQPAELAGELGGMTLTGGWATVPLAGAVASPIVIAGPASSNDPDPGVVRLRNVGGASFEARFEEWNYLDRSHGAEQAAFLALPPGRYSLPDGSLWEVGSFPLSGTKSWSQQSFAAAFPAAPALLLTAQTSNGGQTVVVRAKAVTAAGFKAALYEQESLQDGHTSETIGYLAIHQADPAGGVVTLGGVPLGYATDLIEATHAWSAWDTAAGTVELRVEEEQSNDSETNHVAENLSVLELDGGIFCQDVESQGGDTAACRMR